MNQLLNYHQQYENQSIENTRYKHIRKRTKIPMNRNKKPNPVVRASTMCGTLRKLSIISGVLNLTNELKFLQNTAKQYAITSICLKTEHGTSSPAVIANSLR